MTSAFLTERYGRLTDRDLTAERYGHLRDLVGERYRFAPGLGRCIVRNDNPKGRGLNVFGAGAADGHGRSGFVR